MGIETILYDYIYRDKSPEAIAQTYSSLTLEQVYATILYYLQNQKQVSQYIADWLEWGHKMREEQKQNPPVISKKISQLRKQRLLSGQSYANRIY